MKEQIKTIAVVVVIIGITWAMNFLGILSPMKNEDIDIVAKLGPNKIDGTNGEKYVLEIEIDKRNSGRNIIYTYMPGHGGVSIYDGQGNFVLAGKAKLNNDAEQIAIDALKDKIGEKGNVSILDGNGIPYESGKYNCKIFYQNFLNLESAYEFYIICVHEGSIFPGDNNWAKVIRIKKEL